jgi:uncharacterized protein
VEIEFDPVKNAINMEKHGISLSRAKEMQALAYVDDRRFEEPRFRLYGTIDDAPYCLAGTRRRGVVRVISLRRVHEKEMRRYVGRTRSDV